jgi:glutamine amidotransferase
VIMRELQQPLVAIVDYGLGNLFSVQLACASAGLRAVITSCAHDVLAADAVILPGVGAFGDAMQALHELGLVTVLRHVADTGKPLFGICLGMQLLMTESYEFGRHAGLGLIPGRVVRFERPVDDAGNILKVPHIGWNRIYHQHNARTPALLQGVANGAYMYFVHSFYVEPVDPRVVWSRSQYGPIEFCSSLRQDHIFACQFHPERSGRQGLRVYHNLAAQIAGTGSATNELPTRCLV